jgi:hypothetical protein
MPATSRFEAWDCQKIFQLYPPLKHVPSLPNWQSLAEVNRFVCQKREPRQYPCGEGVLMERTH